MLKTKDFEFNRKGQITIYSRDITIVKMVGILRMCVIHARTKKIKKPAQYRLGAAA
jgi:hypothetical protein